MPATRSRTENWRGCLQNLYERGGALEITLPRYLPDGKLSGAEENEESQLRNLIWRVRIMNLRDDAIFVEEASVLGRKIQLDPGKEIIAIIAIGQNRWMFRTTIDAIEPVPVAGGRTMMCLRLAMPDKVERCQRRNFYRVPTVGLRLPEVELHPLLVVESAKSVEDAIRAIYAERRDNPVAGRIGPDGVQREETETFPLPIVGPGTKTTLLNIGGGGVGLLAQPEDRSAFESERLFWLRIDLGHAHGAPIGIVARLRHTHYDSAQRLYAGMSFEFGHNPEHENFVVDEICRYVAGVQREQLARKQSPAN